MGVILTQRNCRDDAWQGFMELFEELRSLTYAQESLREVLHPLRRQPFPEVNCHGLRAGRWREAGSRKREGLG